MKLYFLHRTELSDRVIGQFRTAEVNDEEARKLIDSGKALEFGTKRAIPRPKLKSGDEAGVVEINTRRIKACREEIKMELNQIVFDRFQEFYARTNPLHGRATRVTTAIEFMRKEAYPYLKENQAVLTQWTRALLHVPPLTFPDFIPCETIYDSKNPKTRKKIGERYLW